MRVAVHVALQVAVDPAVVRHGAEHGGGGDGDAGADQQSLGASLQEAVGFDVRRELGGVPLVGRAGRAARRGVSSAVEPLLARGVIPKGVVVFLGHA